MLVLTKCRGTNHINEFTIYHLTMTNSVAQKRSWSELLSAVKATRNLSCGQSSRTPNNFTFSDTKLYFLALPEGRSEYTLFYVELKSNESEDVSFVPTASWYLLLDLDGLRPFQGFSREEELLRERKRLGSFGITSYEYDKNSRSILFPACSSLYMCRDHVLPSAPGDSSARLVPGEVKTQTNETRMDPKISPSNSDVIAFIHHNDLWVTNVSSGKEKRLTWTNSGMPSNNAVDEPVSAGVPSFVVQEEFDRYTGYWWQPKMKLDNANVEKYGILYEEVDESEVEILTMAPTVEATAPSSSESFRYPRAGTQNATSCLKLVEFSVEDSGEFSEETHTHELKVSLQEAFPWMEYIVRCGWLPDGNSIWAQLLDRSQQRLALVLIPLSLFIPAKDVDSMDHDGFYLSDTMKVLIDETSDVWINVSDIVHFVHLQDSSPGLVQFIWSSEMTGFRHLYLASTNCASSSERPLNALVTEEEVTFCQLTSGEWEVDGQKIWVDETKSIVYFMGTKDSPVEQHLYAVSYRHRPVNIYCLTQPGFSHSVTMNEDRNLFVSVYSSINESPAVTVYEIVHVVDPSSEVVVMARPRYHIRPPGQLNDSLCPDLVDFRSKHGHDVYGMVFKPPNFQPGVKYPTVLFVYGGPAVQIVTNCHKGARYLRLQTLAMLGYVVLAFDCRGSYHRGKQFEGYLKNNLGCIEIEDQVEALLHMAKTTDYIDISRVAIHGWSYGGYLALKGLLQRPEIFKVAVAGAPVTDWEAYDTGYTERYMNTPQLNPLAYSRSSILNSANLFPDQENRLLIVHGLIDENVHFHHTSLLIDRLIKAGKPYQLQVYPSERHGIRQARASEHYEASVLSFLEHNL